ncbi:MAG: substrate-binding domain-containing protein [Lachnospiraceae bacterium]|nr:substrate-binding domain-containing protein [Lachnospiraceae bacterium]
MKKKIISFVMLATMMFSLAACGGKANQSTSTNKNESSSSKENIAEISEETADKKSDIEIKIACLLPSGVVPRWAQDYSIIEKYCNENGYQSQAIYADDDVATQIQQIESYVSKGYNAIIIVPVDGEAVSAAVAKAREQGVAVVSFDRMVKNTEIDYYATFDNFGVGAADGQYVVDALNLDNTDGPYNIELFTGDIADNNALLTYEGMMSVLQPYIDEGKLVVKSGQTEYEQVCTESWDSEKAQKRMENILSGYYANDTIDAVCTTYCGMALGSITALKSAGYGTADKPLPITTGQDAEVAACKSILNGELTMSILKDDRVLCPIAVDMCVAAVTGQEYPVNDTETYDNGAGTLKTYLGDITPFDLNNFDEVIYESGFFTEEDLK